MMRRSLATQGPATDRAHRFATWAHLSGGYAGDEQAFRDVANGHLLWSIAVARELP